MLAELLGYCLILDEEGGYDLEPLRHAAARRSWDPNRLGDQVS